MRRSDVLGAHRASEYVCEKGTCSICTTECEHLLRRQFGRQLATVIEPALPFVGYAAASAAAFTVGMGISQVLVRSLVMPLQSTNSHRIDARCIL